MHDRYAGDIGDVGKFPLLRGLATGRRLGVCWYARRWGSTDDGSEANLPYTAHGCQGDA